MKIEEAKKISTKNKQRNKYLVFSCDSRNCSKGLNRDEPLIGTTHIYSEELNVFICLDCGKEVKIGD